MSHTVLITGANRGLGLEFTRQYAKAGWQVLATCRHPESAKDLQNIAKTGDIKIFTLDITDSTQIQGLAQQLATQSIDLLLNNAGVNDTQGQSFADIDAEEWLHIFNINCVGPMLMVQAFLPAIMCSKLKIIANMSTVLASLGAPEWQAKYYMYRSSKAALNSAMSNLAVELAPQGIKCLILSPGWVKTAMGGPDAPLMPAESVQAMRDLIANATPAMSGQFLSLEGKNIIW